MKKCDIIIPVYNAPEWVKLCVYAVVKNTPIEYINKIYLMNDNSNPITLDCLNNLKEKYSDIICLVSNKENLGFVKNVNKGLKRSKADYVLLLNTDCLLSKNTIPKLIKQIENNSKIGLICPISSNAANLTLEMFEGFSYTQMDQLLEEKFSGMNFDACTVVGNCLMITKECIDGVGYLDEIYGMGYGEETDYQFKALEKGFEAKVAIDTYVFHKSEVSFGTSSEKRKRQEANAKIFFERWGKQYQQLLIKYNQADPIKYIDSNLTIEDKQIVADTLFYLPDVIQNAGGCHVVFDIVNYLVINGLNSNVLYNNFSDYKEIILFNPINMNIINKVEVKQIVSTIWASTYLAKKIADNKNIPLINFVQGYEEYFENGSVYGMVELSYKMSDYLLTISNYLKNKLKDIFDINSDLILNSINLDLLNHINENAKARRITVILRNNVMKGDFLLVDLLKIIGMKYHNIEINVIYMNEYISFPSIHNSDVKINKFLGPLSRSKVNSILRESDIFIDASMNEGFGLMALEAMASGAVPIVNNSFGVLEYMQDGENGFVISEVNNVDCFIKRLDLILNDDKLFNRLKKNGKNTVKSFDYDDAVIDYINFFAKERTKIQKNIEYSEEERKILDTYFGTYKNDSKVKKFVYLTAKIIPKTIKRRMKRVITALYKMYD